MRLRKGCLLLATALITASGRAAPAEPARDAWREAHFRYTPAVQAAFLAEARDRALAELAGEGIHLPGDFLAWVESDPVVRTTVYGARRDPRGVLRWLRALELDLGEDAERRRYTQLALATAVVCAPAATNANLAPRPPLQLAIGGDPRVRVDTRATDRPLDLHDHLINFLEDHTLEEDVVVGQKEEPPELKYDDRGIAIPPPKGTKPRKVNITERRTRSLYAADVIASAEWQAKLNDYLAARGFTHRVDCGDRVVHWKSTEMVRGEANRRVAEAFKLFRAAYEAKGRLPAQRDPPATPAERCAYLIRNDAYRFPDDLQAARKWPRFPLDAPWPVLTLLVENSQPLREREERWLAFRDRGELKTYGEYIGGIAQQYDMQSARRVKEYPFQYGSVQMMLKDGGVCGTMANIAVRSYNALGIPASTAGQPGHCALVLFARDEKTGAWLCKGGQYATAGDAGTGVHAPWVFGDTDARRPMVYHQSVAWAVNHGFQGYLDSLAAFTFHRQLPEEERKAHGSELLLSALRTNPYNILNANALVAGETNPVLLAKCWPSFATLAAGGKPGCPSNGLYHTSVREAVFARLAALPPPADPAAAASVLAFLEAEGCTHQGARVAYRVAVHGRPAVVRDVASAFTAHLATNRTDDAVASMADALAAVATHLTNRQERVAWARARWDELQGRELYAGRKGAPTLDRSVGVLARLAGVKPRPAAAQLQSYLDELTARFRAGLADGARTPQSCKTWASLLGATARQIKDTAQARPWLAALEESIRGRETFTFQANGKPRSQRDPCADEIARLRQAADGDTSS